MFCVLWAWGIPGVRGRLRVQKFFSFWHLTINITLYFFHTFMVLIICFVHSEFLYRLIITLSSCFFHCSQSPFSFFFILLTVLLLWFLYKIMVLVLFCLIHLKLIHKIYFSFILKYMIWFYCLFTLLLMYQMKIKLS